MEVTMLKLYDYFRSSACYRVRIALNLKDLEYECIPIHLVKNGGEQFSSHYDMLNPQHLVPTLQDGKDVITQSLAIMEYLEEKFPLPALLPKTAQAKARVRAFALAIVADTHPLNNLRVLNYLTASFSLSEEQKNRWYAHWITNTFTALEKQLQHDKQSDNFCFGKSPSLADICLVPQMYNARRFACDLSAFPTLVAIDANCQQHPAFLKAAPHELVA